MTKKGLFIGLTTLDFIYLTEKIPAINEKIVAEDETIAAGGPVTNAAVTFSYLGNKSKLVTVLGKHTISNLIKTDLADFNINICDVFPDNCSSPPVSSIIVNKGTGLRSIISINATKIQGKNEQLPADILAGIDIILIDGHQIEISEYLAKLGKQNNIPIVIDGGSWKAGFERILPYVDYAICSANFQPPNCHNQDEIFAYLSSFNIPNIAITQGEKPLQYLTNNIRGEIPVKSIKAVDTLGAGDIFHGAFCHYILQENFTTALQSASKIASYSCQFFGTRNWLK
jgi:sugar/nucleoside kinase (ribokinase family)